MTLCEECHKSTYSNGEKAKDSNLVRKLDVLERVKEEIGYYEWFWETLGKKAIP